MNWLPLALATAVAFGAYNVFIKLGSGKIDQVLGANSPRFTGTVPPEAEVLLDELTVFGTPEQARERLARWHEAGADMPLVFIRPNLEPADIERTLSAFTPMLESRQ